MIERFIDKVLALSLLFTIVLTPGSLTRAAPSARPDTLTAARIIYVNHAATGANNGVSWLDAFTSLQPALDVAVSGDQIWVATGVYTPTNVVGREATFRLQDNVEIYGGFASGETQLSERDWEIHLTVLSGDLDKNDFTDAHGVVTDTANINGDNACHVVTSNSVTRATVLDGLVITAGQADLRGLVNDETDGGGMLNIAGSPTLRHLVFSGNLASGQGGGLLNHYGENDEVGHPLLDQVVFRGNWGRDGGGMASNCGVPELIDVLFESNHTQYNGAGMLNQGSHPVLVNVIFRGNHASSYGGGLHNLASHPTLNNVLFSGNYAGYYGGALYNEYHSRPSLMNVTMSGNHAGQDGGGIYNSTSCIVTLINSLLWGNSPEEIYNVETADTTATYSLIQGGYAGEGNLDADPQFVAPRAALEAPTLSGNYHLRYGSPGIDAGSNAALTVAMDLQNNPRVRDGNGDGQTVVDIGAYEVQQYGVQTEIGPTGGGLVSPLDNTTYIFPVDAFTATVLLVHSPHPPNTLPATGPLASNRHAFDVTAVYSDTGQPAQLAPGTHFTITIAPLDKGSLISGTLALWWWDEDISVWSQAGITGTVDSAQQRLTAQLSHLSLFAVLGETRRIYLPLILRNAP